MVCKNEGRTLAAAVQSVYSVVDEVVIGVDDSCTDDTPQIARQLASPGKLFDFTWTNDFSAARNEAIQRASGDLILILDGHEFLPPNDHPVAAQLARMRGHDLSTAKLPTALATLEMIHREGIHNGCDVGCFTLAMNVDQWGIPQLFFLQPRIFRNDGNIRYANAVHNALVGYKKEQAIAYPEMVLIHNMPPEREQERKGQRQRMNVSGLFRDVKKQRGIPLMEQDARPYFYLGNSYADMGNEAKAIYWYEQYLKRSRFGDEKYQALQQLGVLYHRHVKDNDRARAFALEAMRVQWRRPEPYVLLSEIALGEGDHEQALHWLDQAQVVTAPHTVMFLQGSVYSYLPEVQRAKCYEAMGDWAKAAEAIERALSWRPADQSLINELRKMRETHLREGAKPNILIVDRLGSFTKDLADNFRKRGATVMQVQGCTEKEKAWCDLAWFEWCDGNIAQWSREHWDSPIICRLHSYEAFSDVPAQVEWNGVAHLVFVAEHIRDLFFARWPQLEEVLKGRVSIIPNGISGEGLTFRERGHGKKIAYLGYLNHKKGVDLLMLVAQSMPDFEFHIAGQFQDPHLQYYVENTITEMPNVWWWGWVPPERKDEWLEDKDYLISPSIVESFGYGIAEAMVKGIKPLILNRPGAIWREVWRNVEDLRAMTDPSSPYESVEYREHILTNFGLDVQMRLTDALVMHLLGCTPAARESLFTAVPIDTAVGYMGIR
jgi:glycosyltransferase involved in cell wall biosynthesis